MPWNDWRETEWRGRMIVRLKKKMTHQSVSAETFAALPWMGHKLLPRSMRWVARGGPGGRVTGRKMVIRAEVITRPFTPKVML